MSNGLRDQRGQVVVFFALLIPVFLALGAVVVGGGNWFVHAKHLQTKVDASALAAGSAWSFPCTSGSDAPITTAARDYVGPHMDDGGTLHPGGYNEQVGEVPGDDVEVRLNADNWFDDDAGIDPDDFTTPPGTDPSAPVCTAKTLDVKATEVNSFPLASIIPLFPDLKRKARVEIQQSAETSGPGLLPLAVRVPKPLNAAAIYVDQSPANFGQILSAVYFNDVCEPPANANCITGMPTGLDHWTTNTPTGGNRATINLSAGSKVGVVVALSHRPKCGTGPCFAINQPTIDELCNQGTTAIAQCFYTTGTSTQTFHSGLQFIRGWDSAPDPGDPLPDLLSTWIEPQIGGGNFCYQGYFSAPVTNDCTVTLRANVDPGFGGQGTTEIRYKLVSGNTSWQEDDAPGPCNSNFGANCVLGGGATGAIGITLNRAYARHAVAIAVYRYNLPAAFVADPANNLPPECAATSPQQACSWYYTGTRSMTDPSGNSGANAIFNNPNQQAFMGDTNRSGPVKYLHLKNVDCTDGNQVLLGTTVTGEAASVQAGQRCFRLEMGLQGALAREQDEYPIQINIGNTSQSAVVDCDPDKANLKIEIEEGCGTPDGFPSYTAHDFAQTDGSGTPYCPDTPGAPSFFFVPKPVPYDDWAPFTCVLTQATAAANQVVQGFNQRIFGVQNNPSCPDDDAPFKKGRNYWHDNNNAYGPYDPDGPGLGTLAMQTDFPTFTRSGRIEPREQPSPEPETSHPNRLRLDDPRFVLLFISPYNSFTLQGNDNYPITDIGGFYITGYGHVLGNGNLQIDDPCATGSGIGAGNTQPPDVDTSTSGAIAWGHFVTANNLSAPGGGNGSPCQEGSLTSCVPVLVE